MCDTCLNHNQFVDAANYVLEKEAKKQFHFTLKEWWGRLGKSKQAQKLLAYYANEISQSDVNLSSRNRARR